MKILLQMSWKPYIGLRAVATTSPEKTACNLHDARIDMNTLARHTELTFAFDQNRRNPFTRLYLLSFLPSFLPSTRASSSSTATAESTTEIMTRGRTTARLAQAKNNEG